ncbi:MAG: hypothetical protein RR740_00425 [Pseudomonas sp.]
MNVLKEKPADNRYYWWLPEFLADNPKDPDNWEIIFCPTGEQGALKKVGFFVGPIQPPTDVDLTNAQ